MDADDKYIGTLLYAMYSHTNGNPSNSLYIIIIISDVKMAQLSYYKKGKKQVC